MSNPLPDFVAPPVPAVEQPSGQPDGGEARAKANEYNEKKNQAREAARSEGTPVTADAPKPTVAPKPQVSAKSGGKTQGQVAQGKQGKKPAAPKAANEKGHGAAPAQKTAPAGPASASAQASISAEVADFLKNAPKDPAPQATHNNVQQLVQSAGDLQKSCPPIGADRPGGDSFFKEHFGNVAKMVDAVAGPSPYAGLGLKYQKSIEVISRIRDFIDGYNGVLGTVGTVLSVVGLIITLTGIGAPLGAPLEAIGNVITLVSLILAGVNVILSAVVQGLLLASAAAMNPAPPDPELRRKIGELINKEAAATAGALVGFVGSLPIIGKVVGAAAGKIGALVKRVIGGIGKGVGKLLGPLAKRVAAGLKRAFQRGASSLGSNAAGRLVGRVAGGIQSGVSSLGRAASSGIGRLRGSVNKYLEGKVGNSRFVNDLERAGAQAKNILDGGAFGRRVSRFGNRLGNRVDYMADKVGSRLSPLADRGARRFNGWLSDAGWSVPRVENAVIEGAEQAAVRSAEQNAIQGVENAAESQTRKAALERAENAAKERALARGDAAAVEAGALARRDEFGARRAQARMNETPLFDGGGDPRVGWRVSGYYKHTNSAFENATDEAGKWFDLADGGASLWGDPGATAAASTSDQKDWMTAEYNRHNTDAARGARAQAGAVKLTGTEALDEAAGSRVRSMLGDLVAPSAAPTVSPAADPAPSASEEPASSSPASAPSAAPASESASTGAIPYWPELLTQYQGDLKDLDRAAAELRDYKQRQLDAYKKAVGIEQDAAGSKASTDGRKQPTADNQAHSKEDQRTLVDFGEKNKAAGAKTDEGKAKQQEAGEQGNRAGAVSTHVPDPPEEKSWWGKFKDALNFVKNWILGYLGKGMAWVQNKITGLVMKVIGVDPAAIKQFTDAAGGNAAVDQAVAEKAGAQTQSAAERDRKTEADAVAGMSEAKKLQHMAQQNIDSADELLGQIAQAQTLLNTEVKQGEQYLNELNAQVAQEQEQQRRDEEAKQREHEQKEQAAQASLPDEGGATPQRADAGQMARVAQAVQFVRQLDTTHAGQLGTWQAEGMSRIGQHRAARYAPDMVARAQAAFGEQGGAVTSAFMEQVRSRGGQLDGLTGRGGLTPAQLAQAAQLVEELAEAADDSFNEVAHALEHEFESVYDALEQQDPQWMAPGAGGAMPMPAAP